MRSDRTTWGGGRGTGLVGPSALAAEPGYAFREDAFEAIGRDGLLGIPFAPAAWSAGSPRSSARAASVSPDGQGGKRLRPCCRRSHRAICRGEPQRGPAGLGDPTIERSCNAHAVHGRDPHQFGETTLSDTPTGVGGPATSGSRAPGRPDAVDRDTFQTELDRLRVREKAHTQESDTIAAARRRLPMVEVDANIALMGPHGPLTLLVTIHVPEPLRPEKRP